MGLRSDRRRRACERFENEGRILLVFLIAILFSGTSADAVSVVFGRTVGETFQQWTLKHPLGLLNNPHGFTLSAANTLGFSAEHIEASAYWGDSRSHKCKGLADTPIASAPAEEPSFQISSDPSSISVLQGGSNSSTITVQSLNGFSGCVTLWTHWASWPAPLGLTINLTSSVLLPADGFSTATLTIAADSAATTGDFVLTVIGDSGTPAHEVRHTLDVPVSIASSIVASDDFMIIVNPSSLILTDKGPGRSATLTVTVQSVGAFSSPVNLTASGGDLTLAFTDTGTPETIVTPPAGREASKVLDVSAVGGGATRIVITGTSGPLIHSVTIPVRVAIEDGVVCLIATATYGSELSPEVQFLRNFRDDAILKTKTGASFMVAFNAWYYSFSPSVAQFIAEHPTLRMSMKYAFYPLLGILRVGAAAFCLFPTSTEAGAVASGLLVSSLIGVVYLSAPLAAVLVNSSMARRTARRLQAPLAVILLGALVAVVFSTVLSGPTVPLVLATSTLVVASVLASAIFTSRGILRLVRLSDEESKVPGIRHRTQAYSETGLEDHTP